MKAKEVWETRARASVTDLELDDGVGGDVVSGRLQALHTHTSSGHRYYTLH